MLRLILVLMLGFTAGLGAQSISTVRVAAAANLSSFEQPLRRAFQQVYPNDVLVLTFASSGALVTQIENGAPYDIFLSADMGFAQKLYDDGFASSTVAPYALGKLALLSTKNWRWDRA